MLVWLLNRLSFISREKERHPQAGEWDENVRRVARNGLGGMFFFFISLTEWRTRGMVQKFAEGNGPWIKSKSKTKINMRFSANEIRYQQSNK